MMLPDGNDYPECLLGKRKIFLILNLTFRKLSLHVRIS